MQEDIKDTKIDWWNITKTLYQNRKNLFISAVIGCIIGGIIAYSIPKSYTVTITIAPETNNPSHGLSNISSMLGINNITGEDAVNVNMIPEIIKTTPFLVDMLQTQLTDPKGNTSYLYNYLDKMKSPWWNYIFSIPKRCLSIFEKQSYDKINQTTGPHPINIFSLTKEEYNRINVLKSLIYAETDKRSSTTQISISLQDPLVAALIADSAATKLQRYITKYKTHKAYQDCIYWEKLCIQRKDEYITSQKRYAKFLDTNKNINSQEVNAEGELLRNTASLAYQVYSQVETQLQMARAKVEEAKPAFAILEPASIPQAPTKPHKLKIIFIFSFLSFAINAAWIIFGSDLWLYFKTKITL